MQQASSVLGITTWHCLPFLFFSPLFFFVYSISWHSPWSSHNARWRGINVGSGSLQQPEGLFLFHALGTLCQPLNAVSLVGFVETACAQRWFSCKLIAAPRVKRVWAVCRQPVRTPPAHDISIAWWGLGAAPNSLSLLLFFFFFFWSLRKEKKAWEKSKRCLLFLENYWMLFTVTPPPPKMWLMFYNK